jgi:hypothetical protein
MSKMILKRFEIRRQTHDNTRKGQGEYSAGYAAGLRGDPEPHSDKGHVFMHGWRNGQADREESNPATTTKEQTNARESNR